MLPALLGPPKRSATYANCSGVSQLGLVRLRLVFRVYLEEAWTYQLGLEVSTLLVGAILLASLC